MKILKTKDDSSHKISVYFGGCYKGGAIAKLCAQHRGTLQDFTVQKNFHASSKVIFEQQQQPHTPLLTTTSTTQSCYCAAFIALIFLNCVVDTLFKFQY